MIARALARPLAMAQQIDYPRLLFCETQRFRQKWLWALAAVVAGAPAALIIWAYLSHPQIHFVFMLGVLAVCCVFPAMVIFVGMRVVVTSDLLLIDFFPFTRRRIRISEIQSAVAEHYRPIKEFGGWGRRWSRYDSTAAYNVSGDRGVRIVLRNGAKILIGSQRAEELAEALTAGRQII